jgi:glycosyltransferase involved in cell wall biosynthesis
MQLVCLSHLRWNFVYQRPQHVLSRFVPDYDVFFIEEFIPADSPHDFYDTEVSKEGVTVLVPRLSHHLSGDHTDRLQLLINRMLADFGISDFVAWYYTPMALPFTRHLTPAVTVFDAMDELSAFKFAPPELKALETEMMERADVVFTGGQSLYEAKKHRHTNIHAFPSSIDKAHFAQARTPGTDPADQAGIPHPRLGFYGVVDERFDLELLQGMATQRPDWQFVIIGPVVKIDPETLPKGANIHYLGPKSYPELPQYLRGWDIALVAFALNESTKFISPTKTPEYLAGGKPVISTPIRDVVYPYGKEGLVAISRNADEAIQDAEQLMTMDRTLWLERVDAFLETNSWEETWAGMNALITKAIEEKSTIIACTTTSS